MNALCDADYAECDISHAVSDILSEWHHWCSGYLGVPRIGSSAIFRQARSPRGWDSIQDIVEREIDYDRMAAVDFHIGEMSPLHRTALQIEARNLATGRSVWASARLPADHMERARIVAAARADIAMRLTDAAIL